MGIQQVNDVTLIRHAYTLTSHQRRGIGAKLIHHLLALAKTQRILVGTWETAPWAIQFYQKHGFMLLQGNKQINCSRNTGTSLSGRLKPQ